MRILKGNISIDDTEKKLLYAIYVASNQDFKKFSRVGKFAIEESNGRKISITSCRRRFAPRHLGSVFCALFGNGAV